MISIVLTFVTMLVSVIPMQRFAKTGRPVEARHSRAHSHSSTFLKYWKTGVPIGIGGCAIGNPEDAPTQNCLPQNCLPVCNFEVGNLEGNCFNEVFAYLPQVWWSRHCSWSGFQRSVGFPSGPALYPSPTQKIIYQLGVLLILYISSIESRVWKRQNLGEVGWFCKYSRNLLVCIRLGLGDAPSHHGSVFFGNLGKKMCMHCLQIMGKPWTAKKLQGVHGPNTCLAMSQAAWLICSGVNRQPSSIPREKWIKLGFWSSDNILIRWGLPSVDP